MPEISNDALRQIIDRVTTEVSGESKAYQKAFEVTDLRAQLGDLAKVGGANAWEISYKTTSASLIEAARLGSAVAWEITYKTSSPALERAGAVEKGGR